MEKEKDDEEDTASIPINSCGCWLSSGEERILVPTSAEETHTFQLPRVGETRNPAAGEAKPERQTARRIALQKNEKEFLLGVDRLYQLASELKQEVEKVPTSEIFSVQMYKRTEEIERLAKQLKAKARG
jgi:hypothetical protein